MAKRRPPIKKTPRKTKPLTKKGRNPPLTYSRKMPSSGDVELVLRSFTHRRNQGSIRTVGGVHFESRCFPQWIGNVFYLQGTDRSDDGRPVVIPKAQWEKVKTALSLYGAEEVGGKEESPLVVVVNLKPDSHPPVPPSLATCEGVLHLLDRLAYGLDGTERGKLWSVLTALRGPDEGWGKDLTTAVVRAKAFPTWMFSANPGADVASDYRENDPKRGGEGIPAITASGHFIAHAKQAFDALGLKW